MTNITNLTNKTQMSYAIPVAGKIQQYGFSSSLQRRTITATVFTLVVFLSVISLLLGGIVREPHGSPFTFVRSTNLIIPPFLRLVAREGLTPKQRSTAMSKVTAIPTPNASQSQETPCLFDLEVLLSEHRDKLAFLADAFSQPINPNNSWELTQQGQDGLHYLLRDLRDDAERMDQINIALFSAEKENAHA